MLLEIYMTRRQRASALLKGFGAYIFGKTPSRILCDEYLRLAMPALCGKVIELGGRKSFRYERLATNASEYIVTNIEDDNKEFDERADILNLPYADGSIDGFTAIALLEHVCDPRKALAEVQRCLKTGGRVLLVVPAMYPRNPAPEEYYRFSPTALKQLLDKCKVLDISCLGGLYSLSALYFGRPLVVRPLGALIYLLDVLFGDSDKDRKYPHLLAVLAEKVI